MANLMLIDDDQTFREMLRQMLERAGHTVFCAENGAEAFKHFPEVDVDLVITDLIMPEKDGIEVIRELSGMAPGMKIIAVSGGTRNLNSDMQLKVARMMGADVILPKPVSRKDILAAIDTLLNRE